MSSLYLPDDPAPVSVRLQHKQRTKQSTAVSGRIQSRLHGGQSYAATLTYPPMRRDQAAALIAYIHELQGRHGVFRVKLPDLAGVPGEAVGNLMNFVGDHKLHIITDTSPLTVMPAARSGGTVRDTDGPYMQCSLSTDVQKIELGKNGLIRLEIDVVERL